MTIRFSALAKMHLERILTYYEQEAGSTVWIAQVLQGGFQHLSRWPRSGHHRYELSNEYRFWLVTPYVIVYTFDTTDLLIVAIMHTSQDIGRHLTSVND